MNKELIVNKEVEENFQSRFCKKMIHSLIKYKPPKLFAGCYTEIDLMEGKFFGEKTIGQLVGKSGERKDEFFSLTGVKPHIEDSKDKPFLILSKYNVREIKLASLLGYRFKTSKSWSSSSIHKHFQQLQKQLSGEEEEIGLKALEQFDSEENNHILKEIIGRMSNEFYSETQTLLDHSIEVAKEAFKAAESLLLNPQKAQKLAFYHDIGKIFLPYYIHSSEKVFEFIPELQDEEIKKCISTHHNTLVSFESPYIALVSLVNRVLSQVHFLSNCNRALKLQSWKFNLLKELNVVLANSSKEDFFSFYILSDDSHIWIVINANNQPSSRESIISKLSNQLEEVINQHNSSIEMELNEEEAHRLHLTIFWLPTESEKASTTKLKLFKKGPESDPQRQYFS